MTSIIQSNRERKSRLDEGLVERLNNHIIEKNDQDSSGKPNVSAFEFSDELRFIDDIDEYGRIINYMNEKFLRYKHFLSDKLKFEDGVMKGSNTYIVLAINRYLTEINSDYRIARLIDIQQTRAIGKYEIDVGICIRGFEGYQPIEITQDNSVADIFKKLAPETSKYTLPIWIDLAQIHLNDDMTFKISEMHAGRESLNLPSRSRYSKTDIYCGLPEMEEENGDKEIFNSNDPISRCVLGVNHLPDADCLYARLKNFTNSSDNCRIVLAKK